jgi:hypothetical protein
LGTWAIKIYDELSFDKAFGQSFHLISVIINMILMLNMVIAIFSETYARLAPQRRGLYYDGLIASMPAMKYEKRWGILILIPAPFNIFGLVCLFTFLCIEKKSPRLKSINEWFVKVAYSPLALLFLIIFMSCNFVISPLAYFKVLFFKIDKVCCSCCQNKRRSM